MKFLNLLLNCYLVMTGDGAVVRGRAYGVRSIRVDGNDALALYSTVRAAREMAIREHRPILIEVTYMSVHCKLFKPYKRHDIEIQVTGVLIFYSIPCTGRP